MKGFKYAGMFSENQSDIYIYNFYIDGNKKLFSRDEKK